MNILKLPMETAGTFENKNSRVIGGSYVAPQRKGTKMTKKQFHQTRKHSPQVSLASIVNYDHTSNHSDGQDPYDKLPRKYYKTISHAVSHGNLDVKNGKGKAHQRIVGCPKIEEMANRNTR